MVLVLFEPEDTHAQSKTEHLTAHKPLMNPIWAAIDKLMYKVSNTNGQVTYTPHFPSELQQLSGKKVKLKGYMVPIKQGRRHATFLLSVLPIYQCMFCGQDGIPPMIEISLRDEKKLIFSEQPITIEGTIYLNSSDAQRTEIQVHEAIAID